MKKIISAHSINDQLNLGSICNSLEKYHCSVKVFEEIIQIRPRHKSALANLAIANGKLDKWDVALPYFEAYFSLGGEGFDVMLWYGRALRKVNQEEKALNWYYKSLVQNFDHLETQSELVDTLANLGKVYESLAFIAHLTNGFPGKDVYWNQRVHSLNFFLKQEAKNIDNNSIRIPSLSGSQYFIPFWFYDSKKDVFFVEFVENQRTLTIPKKVIDDNQITYQTIKSKFSETKPGFQRVKIENIQFGPWTLKSIDAEICETNCGLKVGKSFFDEIEIGAVTEDGVQYYIFQQ